ncbi:4900_t:CDS:2, partial [Ambispora gerdemannii]
MPPQEVIDPTIEGPQLFRREEITKLVNWRDEKEKVKRKNARQKNFSETPWYIIVDNKVYDIREFVKEHPGGAVILTHIGKDATDAFYNFHPESAFEILSNFYVGDLDPTDFSIVENGFTKELRELREHFKQLNYYDSSKSYYAFKILSNLTIWAISCAILVNYGRSLIGILSSAALMGLFWQQCGWLAHDFLHHQVFEERKYNDLMGAFIGSVCQGFTPSWWKDKHNTHHAAPNVHGQDPDINTHPLLSWSEYALTDMFDPEFTEKFIKSSGVSPTTARFLVKYQTLLYFPILTFARLSWLIQSFVFVLPDGQDGKSVKMPVATAEKIGLGIHYAWVGALIWYIPTISFAITFFFSSQMICGILLALVFSLNHNGMRVLTEEESQNMDFFEEQVITGRDVISAIPAYQWWIDWFTGGLNYQIEHHLFPSIPRHHFHKIQPTIENLCIKYKISYHRTTFWAGTWE